MKMAHILFDTITDVHLAFWGQLVQPEYHNVLAICRSQVPADSTLCVITEGEFDAMAVHQATGCNRNFL